MSYFVFVIHTHWMIYFLLCSLSAGNQWNPGRWDGTGKDGPEYRPVGSLSRGEAKGFHLSHTLKKRVEYLIVSAVVTNLRKHVTSSFFFHLHPLKRPFIVTLLFSLLCFWLVSKHPKQIQWNLGEKWWAIPKRRMHTVSLHGFLFSGLLTHTNSTCPPAESFFLFLHRRTTSGVHSWSSLLHPRSTTGIRSSLASCPVSRWGSLFWNSAELKHLRNHVRRSPDILISNVRSNSFNGMVPSLGSGTIKGVARSFLGVSKKL